LSISECQVLDEQDEEIILGDEEELSETLETIPISPSNKSLHPQSREELDKLPSVLKTPERSQADKIKRQELEIGELRRMLSRIEQRLESGSSDKEKPRRPINWKNCTTTLPLFSGKKDDNVMVFIGKMNKFFHTNPEIVWDETNKKNAYIRAFRDSAAKWYESNVLPDATYKSLIDALKGWYWTDAHKTHTRKNLESIHFLVGEDMASFTSRVTELADTLKDTDKRLSDQDLIDIILNSFEDTTWRDIIHSLKILGKQWRNRQELKAGLRSLEITIGPIQLRSKKADPSPDTALPIQPILPIMEKRESTEIKCWSCGGTGHKSNVCANNKRKEHPVDCRVLRKILKGKD